MDYSPEDRDRIRQLEREIARLRHEQSQFFSRYQPQMQHNRIVRMARTIADEQADPTYPIQGIDGGNCFPIVFLSAGFTNEAGRHSIEAVAHDTVPQAFVRILSFSWVPESTELQVWQDRGTDADFKGEWFSSFVDRIRLGITSEAIAKDDNGDVVEWDTNNYGAEDESGTTWLCRNWCGYDLEPNTRVYFEQIGSVAYIINAACSAEEVS